MPEEDDSEAEDSGEWNTGPFCRHWGDPADCDILCTCKHPCKIHDLDDDSSECNEEGCGCKKFEEAE